MPTKAEALAELARRGKLPKPNDLSGRLSEKEQADIINKRTAATNIRSARGNAFEYMKANSGVKTGGIMAIPLVSEMIGAFNPQVATMQGLSNDMVPGMHITPGPMTDADAKLYRSAIPNPNLPRDASMNLAKNISRKEQEVAARSAFFERYAQRLGTLNGADLAFNKWWSTYKPPEPPASPPPAGGGGGGAKYLGTE